MGVIAYIWQDVSQNNSPNTADPLQVPCIPTAVMCGKLPNPMTQGWFFSLYLVKDHLSLHLQTSPDFPAVHLHASLRWAEPRLIISLRVKTPLESTNTNTRRSAPVRCFVPHFAFIGAAGWTRQRRRKTTAHRSFRYLACVTVLRFSPHLDCRRVYAAHTAHRTEHGKVLFFLLTKRKTSIKISFKNPFLHLCDILLHGEVMDTALDTFLALYLY